VEAAIHAMRNLFEKENTKAGILVDTDNAFNRINRQAARHNINILYPSFNNILQNTCGTPIRLFVTGEGELSSTEDTTQGDSLAMAMYALAVTLLIQALPHINLTFQKSALLMMLLLLVSYSHCLNSGSTSYILDHNLAIFQRMLRPV